MYRWKIHKKNYLVALVVTDNLSNEEKIKEFISNLNKNVSLVEKIKNFNLYKDYTLLCV